MSVMLCTVVVLALLLLVHLQATRFEPERSARRPRMDWSAAPRGDSLSGMKRTGHDHN